MFNSDGTPQDLKVKAIARTYGYVYQGTPSFSYFSTRDGSYATNFLFDINTTGATQVFQNKAVWYPNGFKVTVSDADKKGF